MYEELKNYLTVQPLARERRHKNRALVNILISHHKELQGIEKEKLVEIVKEYNSLEREWRAVLEDHPELRGSDYETKQTYELKKQKELGYRI